MPRMVLQSKPIAPRLFDQPSTLRSSRRLWPKLSRSMGPTVDYVWPKNGESMVKTPGSWRISKLIPLSRSWLHSSHMGRGHPRPPHAIDHRYINGFGRRLLGSLVSSRRYVRGCLDVRPRLPRRIGTNSCRGCLKRMVCEIDRSINRSLIDQAPTNKIEKLITLYNIRRYR